MRDARTQQQIREHYDIEVGLAERLKSASAGERRALYTEVYEELFERVPHHPQITDKITPEGRLKKVRQKMRMLRRYLSKDVDYLELGPGDCAMAFEVARHARSVVAVDVSPSITDSAAVPDNFRLVISDGSSVPLDPGSIDVVFSDQLMEHLHQDDAVIQLSEIYNCLRSGGRYVCMTPNRLSGPHDISSHFDESATGLHLLEYDLRMLIERFEAAGFHDFQVYAGGKGIYFRFPLRLALLTERILARLPVWVRRSTAGRALLGLNVVARRP